MKCSHRCCCAIIVLILTVVGQAQLPADKLGPPSYAFVNGLWFDGKSFKPSTIYAVDGRFTFRKPTRVDRTLNLKGAYVIPPFAEAHNHNLITGSTLR